MGSADDRAAATHGDESQWRRSEPVEIDDRRALLPYPASRLGHIGHDGSVITDRARSGLEHDRVETLSARPGLLRGPSAGRTAKENRATSANRIDTVIR